MALTHLVPLVRTSPYKSVQVRIPLPTPCALRNALCQPMGMRFVLWRTPCTWRTGGNLTFPPVYPPFAPCVRVCTGMFYPLFCAMCCGISGAHSPHIALCRLPSEASGEGGSVQVRTNPYKSVFPCSHPVHCAMRFASRLHHRGTFAARKIFFKESPSCRYGQIP